MELIRALKSKKKYSDDEWRDLVSNTTDLDYIDNSMQTALHYACKKNNVLVAELLINAGANVEIRDNHGNTPAFYLCGNGTEILQLLLDKNINVNLQNERGTTILMNSTNVTFSKMLLDAGADITLQNIDKFTALHFKNMHHQLIIDWLQLIELLGTQDTVNLQSIYGTTPLMCMNNPPIQCLELLLSLGADPNISDNDGETFLFKYGFDEEDDTENLLDYIDILLKHGLNINNQDFRGETIIFKCLNGEPKFVEAFVQGGIDLNIQDKEGNTVAHKCILDNSKHTQYILSQPRLDTSIKNNDGFTVRDLLDSKIQELVEYRNLV